MLTTAEAAEELGVSQRRVVQLIGDGRLPAEWYGSLWLVRRRDLRHVRVRLSGAAGHSSRRKQ